MADITAKLVKELRDATNVSMMECKKALVEADGNLDEAMRILRERGMAVAAKKASRTANQGLVASARSEDGKTASLVEVNCETDFVARNETFIAFVDDLAKRALETDEQLGETLKDEVTQKVAEIGENILIPRNTRMTLQGPGKVASYIHLNGKVGVLVELGCEKDETAGSEVFSDLARDLTLHVAACNPRYMTRDEVPEDEVAREREIFAKQAGEKPPQIIEKIVEGKIGKYFAEICFVEQGFVKEPKQSITELLEEKGKDLGETLTIRRCVRYQIGQ